MTWKSQRINRCNSERSHGLVRAASHSYLEKAASNAECWLNASAVVRTVAWEKEKKTTSTLRVKKPIQLTLRTIIFFYPKISVLDIYRANSGFATICPQRNPPNPPSCLLFPFSLVSVREDMHEFDRPWRIQVLSETMQFSPTADFYGIYMRVSAISKYLSFTTCWGNKLIIGTD